MRPRRSKSVDAEKRLLVAIDDSAASRRAVAYVARIIGGRKGFRIRLFHVRAPLPPRLVDFAVGEDPGSAQRRRTEGKHAHAAWVTQGEKAAQAVFSRAKSILRRARTPATAIETELATSRSDQDLASTILEAARTSRCGTLVVGRESFAGFRELFQRHVHAADELIRQAQGFALWVVE